jgi:hypothetical protein
MTSAIDPSAVPFACTVPHFKSLIFISIVKFIRSDKTEKVKI